MADNLTEIKEKLGAPVWIISEPETEFGVQYLSSLSNIGMDFFLSEEHANEVLAKLEYRGNKHTAIVVKYVPELPLSREIEKLTKERDKAIDAYDAIAESHCELSWDEIKEPNL